MAMPIARTLWAHLTAFARQDIMATG